MYYILLLFENYLKAKDQGASEVENDESDEIRESIARAVNASPSLRNKRDLVEQFVDTVNTSAQVDEQWKAFITRKKHEELERLIVDENLNAPKARHFIENAFRDGGISENGTAISEVLPPVSRFAPNNQHAVRKQRVLEKLSAFFKRYYGLS